jgi:hypothetical protein
VAVAGVSPALIAWYIVPETGPATVTSSPGFNSNGGEVAVQYTWVCLIITFLIKNAVKGESQGPAGNFIVSGDLLTTIDIISNLLPVFTFAGEG